MSDVRTRTSAAASGALLGAPRRAGIAGATLCLCTTYVGAALAVDHTNLEEGLPTSVADAYPIEYLGREVQSQLQYRYEGAGVHQVHLEPRFEFGFPYNGQVAVHVPLLMTLGSDDEDTFRVGRVGLEYLYNLNQETLTLPAFALAAGLQAPDTQQGGSFDPLGRFILTKTLPRTTLWQRVHLNVLVQGNVAREAEERSVRVLLGAAYSLRLSATAIGIASAIRDWNLEGDPPHNLGELGIRVQVTPLLALAFGVGAGFRDDGEPLARATGAFQWFAF